MIGYQEIIIILIIALLVFGPQKLPEIGRQVGSALRELRKMSSDMQRALNLDDHGGYDRYDYDRDRYDRDRNPQAIEGSDQSAFAYSAPEGDTYAHGSLNGDGTAAVASLPSPPGPPVRSYDAATADVASSGPTYSSYASSGEVSESAVTPYPPYLKSAAGEGTEYSYPAAENGGTAASYAADSPPGSNGTGAADAAGETRLATAQAASQISVTAGGDHKEP